jgi:hypothetical protein
MVFSKKANRHSSAVLWEANVFCMIGTSKRVVVMAERKANLPIQQIPP